MTNEETIKYPRTLSSLKNDFKKAVSEKEKEEVFNAALEALNTERGNRINNINDLLNAIDDPGYFCDSDDLADEREEIKASMK